MEIAHAAHQAFGKPVGVTLVGHILYSGERRAHAPLPAEASVAHGIGVVVTESHGNRAAGSGCHDAAC
jgi:hypothetical protein